MQLLEDRIRKDGKVREGNVLKVDSFLNHQMDVNLFREIGKEFQRRFAGEEITKILTIEASGIGMFCKYPEISIKYLLRSTPTELTWLISSLATDHFRDS